MMKPTLALQPNNYAYADIKAKFADGKPLSCTQLNFLDWHQKELSSAHLGFDPLLNYYLKHHAHGYIEDHSFLLPHEVLNAEDIAKLKKRLKIVLQGQSKSIELKMTPTQFQQFKTFSVNELIFYHGNQLLTGAPFLLGGIPHIIYFQWGNSFGVAKYVVLAEEKALKSNLLIYFEDMGERLLDECVYDYQRRFRNELRPQHHLQPAMHMHPQPIPQVTEQRSLFKTPTLTLSPLQYVKVKG